LKILNSLFVTSSNNSFTFSGGRPLYLESRPI
jgi:hypothetical protein